MVWESRQRERWTPGSYPNHSRAGTRGQPDAHMLCEGFSAPALLVKQDLLSNFVACKGFDTTLDSYTIPARALSR